MRQDPLRGVIGSYVALAIVVSASALVWQSFAHFHGLMGAILFAIAIPAAVLMTGVCIFVVCGLPAAAACVRPKALPQAACKRPPLSDLHFSPRSNRAAEIHWREWGDAAFLESDQSAKPVVLAISAVWCHWCHVMDETTYSTDAVIRLLNDRFIPVRVDNDRRPDVNARYNMGGWPTTAVLTPDGEIVHGGTYIPPDAMLRLLGQIDKFYAEPDNRLELAQQVRRVKDERNRAGHDADPSPRSLDVHTAEVVLARLEERFDPDYGGFGDEPKFPQTTTLQFLLDHWARTQDPRDERMVLASLRGMARGGMYDQVEGGFFRYSTTRDFSVPHFEKMLEDLGGLLLACARAYAAFDAEDLGLVACDVRRYLDRRLWQTDRGAYGGSQDADEDYFKLDEAGRAVRTPPFVDPTIYTSWNAETARSLLFAAPLLRGAGTDPAEWTQRGLAVLETLWSRLLRDGLMCRYFDGSAHIRGLLGDQAWSVASALAAHAATGDGLWLTRAGELVAASEVLFDGHSGYADRLASENDPGRLSDHAVPFGENAVMAQALLAYSAAAAAPEFSERARRILGRFEQEYRRFDVFASGYASAVMQALDPPASAVIVGSPAATADLRHAALAMAQPALAVIPVDPNTETQRLHRLGHEAPSDGSPVAYLCRGTSCFARVTRARDLIDALGRPQPT